MVKGVHPHLYGSSERMELFVQIGKRLKNARLAKGLSLEQLADALTEQGHPITKAALSKYERDQSSPSATLLRALARSLNVESSYFWQEGLPEVSWCDFRKTTKLGKKEQERLKASGTGIAEDFLWLEDTLAIHPVAFPASRVRVDTVREAEEAALELRKTLKLGTAPIENLVRLLEECGAIVITGHLPEDAHFDGLSGWADGRPVIFINSNRSVDRTRYNLAHEFGHLFLDCDHLPEKERETIAHRFAAAFIVPEEAVVRELGGHRRNLNLAELGLLKRKYGLSIQAWIRRAHDLELINPNLYRNLYTELSTRGWRKREPEKFDYQGNEEPLLLKQYTLRALNEGIIDAERAGKICPDLLEGRTPVKKAHSAQELLKLSSEERNRILEAAADLAYEDYVNDPELTAFEAFEAADVNS